MIIVQTLLPILVILCRSWVTGFKVSGAKALCSCCTVCRFERTKLPSGVGFHYLCQPGELEGGRHRATDPVFSLEVYQLGGSVVKPDELFCLAKDRVIHQLVEVFFKAACVWSSVCIWM